ncbi:hypothetical protein EJB05_14659, partial [Eragrostis curvula]
MALRHLASKVGLPALRRASAPSLSPAAGARGLSYSSNQGPNSFQDFADMIKRTKSLGEQHLRLFKILEAERDKEIKLFEEQWDGFEKIMRRTIEDMARFRKKVDKIGDVSAAVGVGAFALAVGVKCSV